MIIGGLSRTKKFCRCCLPWFMSHGHLNQYGDEVPLAASHMVAIYSKVNHRAHTLFSLFINILLSKS